MKFITNLILVVLLLISSQIISNAQTLDKKVISELFSTYGFCKGQALQLDHIEKTFPTLRSFVQITKSEFSLTFGKSCDFLVLLMPQESVQELDKQIREQASNLSIKTQSEAQSYLKEVQERAKGKIISPVKENLLWLNPDITENPEIEFLRGFTKKYNTANHNKAKGLDITIQVPISWTQREGNRPNIIQFFRAGNPFENSAAVSLMVRDIPLYEGRKITNKEAQLLFTKEMLKEFAGNDPIIESGRVEIEGQPAGYTITETTATRLGITIKQRILAYMIYYNGKLILLHCVVGGKNGEFNFNDKMTKFKPLFMLIANSIILNDKYK